MFVVFYDISFIFEKIHCVLAVTKLLPSRIFKDMKGI